MADQSCEHENRDLAFRRVSQHLRRDSLKQASLTLDKHTTPILIEGTRKRFPESLHFTPSSLRFRSRTASSRSSISSAHIPDSATTYSHSTLVSPISTSYTSDIQELLAAQTLEGSPPSSRFHHRHKPSDATCSTFVNDDDDGRLSQGPAKQDLLGFGAAHSYFIDESPKESQSNAEDSESDAEGSVKEEEAQTPGLQSKFPYPDSSPESETPKWETASTASEGSSSEDAEDLLGHTLQLVYGVDLAETSAPIGPLRKLATKFIDDVGQCIMQAASDGQTAQDMSTASSSSTPSHGGIGSGSQGQGKRKKQVPGRDDDGEELSDGEGFNFLPVKRPRPNPRDEENLRLSCPFRKRNPQRFNVRDHHSCAMTYFPKFAELRQHIVKQHKRDDPSAFVCDRCNHDFRTSKELRDHRRQPKELMCDISDNDPESGIDGPTSNKLLSRKRASGTSPEVQWREIWGILFPDDEDSQIKTFEFTPVIEHFELSENYLISFSQLQMALRDKISNVATLDTLATKFQQCFIETVDGCVADAQTMPYMNRSNKKGEPSRLQSTQVMAHRNKPKEKRPRPDSGVVMDDGSEESDSIMATGLSHSSNDKMFKEVPSRRGSNLANETMRDTAPTPSTNTLFDQSTLFTSYATSMPLETVDPSHAFPITAAAAVQAWSNGVVFPQPGTLDFSTTDQFMNVRTSTPMDTPWDETLYGPEFTDMNHGFNNFTQGS